LPTKFGLWLSSGIFLQKTQWGNKMVRSADSISANIAEGFGRYHYKENKNFCYFSRGSIIETKGWLKKAVIRSLVDEETHLLLLKKLETIHLKLNTYIKYIGKFKNDQ
jgi:four helix bundle protein